MTFLVAIALGQLSGLRSVPHPPPRPIGIPAAAAIIVALFVGGFAVMVLVGHLRAKRRDRS